MTPVSAAATTCFAFAAGIFFVLSCIERPVWRLMAAPMDGSVADQDARLVHAQLKSVIHLLPPAMMTTMAAGVLLLVVQAWRLDAGWLPAAPLVALVAGLSWILPRLRSCIKAVDEMHSDGDIAAVRIGVGRLASLHHAGLGTVALVTLLQLLLAFASW